MPYVIICKDKPDSLSLRLATRDVHIAYLDSHASKLLAAGGAWTVRVWDVGTGKEVRLFEGHRGPVKALAFSPDGKRLATASRDSTVLIWDVSR